MKDPAYYRDLINRILNEEDEDDIPRPPSRQEIKLQQYFRRQAGHPAKFECHFDEDGVAFNADGLNFPLSDGNFVDSLFASTDINSASATLTTSYREGGHPYANDNNYDIEQEIKHLFKRFGFDVDVSFSESGMQDDNYLHFDAEISPETEEIWCAMAEKNTAQS